GALPSLTGAAGVDADGTEPSGVLPVDADVGVTPGKRSTTFSSLTDGTTSAADSASASTSRMPVLIQPFRTICGSTARQSTTQPMPTAIVSASGRRFVTASRAAFGLTRTLTTTAATRTAVGIHCTHRSGDGAPTRR